MPSGRPATVSPRPGRLRLETDAAHEVTALAGRGAVVTRISRYPVKGLSPEDLGSVDVTPESGFPFDRIFALARPDGGFTPDRFTPLSKSHFYMLMRNERLAGLGTVYNDSTDSLAISVQGHPVLEVDLESADGRARLSEFIARVLDLDPSAAPVVARRDGYNYSDSSAGGENEMTWISIINLASVRDFEERTGLAIDARRFRANLLIDGIEPWQERSWLGSRLTVGGVAGVAIEETARCAATEVDPATATRDIPLPRLLKREYGHDIMGIFLKVHHGGRISLGDTVTTADGTP